MRLQLCVWRGFCAVSFSGSQTHGQLGSAHLYNYTDRFFFSSSVLRYRKPLCERDFFTLPRRIHFSSSSSFASFFGPCIWAFAFIRLGVSFKAVPYNVNKVAAV